MDKDRIRGFAEAVYDDMAGAMTVAMAFVGTRTGLFRAMAGKGPMTPAAIAEGSGLQPRYVEEWLKGIATAGYLDHDPQGGTFALPDEHAYLLASEGTDHFMGGLFDFAPVAYRVAPRVADAFRSGGGVAFEDFGPDCVAALDLINSGQYEKRLGSYWLPSMPDVATRLEQGGRALDFGCGVGRVAMAIARTYPSAEVIGLDPDTESIRQARAAAEAAGLGDKVRFAAESSATYRDPQGFDLIAACDCIHDFSEPERTLAEIRALLRPGGALFVVEPRAGDSLAENMHALGTVYYGFSLFHCMTQSLANGGPGLGTCMGPAQTMDLLRRSGFGTVEQLDIKSQTHLFYAARA
ncbi:MAG TPA: class I SAM-dependent methyltransferase [Thermohalobaculum sp.]|nr:class I SAM-dependent methyltransferase [Thermohalobaculum sp.]